MSSSFNSKIAKRLTEKALCHLKSKWEALISSILDGTCMCHKRCRLIYCTTKIDTCPDPQPGSSNSFFNLNSGANSSKFNQSCDSEMTTEDLQLAVFFKEKLFIDGDNNKFAMKDGMAEIITSKANMKKLLQATEIIIDLSIRECIENRYTRVSVPEACGMGDGCDYYILRYERCGA